MASHPHDERASRLAALLALIQRRWGSRALQSGAPPPSSATLPTGLGALDRLLDGGFPAGAITELLGAPTAGTTTIALSALAQAQIGGSNAAVLDLDATFDAAYAATCGVDLATLRLIRPHDLADTLSILPALISSGIGFVFLPNLAILAARGSGPAQLAQAVRVLPRLLLTNAACIVTTTLLPYPPALVASLGFYGSPLGQAAALRLVVTRLAWQLDDTANPACLARATILARQQGRAGESVDLTLVFPRDEGATL